MVAETPANGDSKALTTVDQTTTLVAVGSAATYVPGDLEAIKKLVTQTKAIGVILPPPDIRAIVDKTAQFVARNGIEFEKRILANEKNNVKFNFLTSTDPYHAYYKVRVSISFPHGHCMGCVRAKTLDAAGRLLASSQQPQCCSIIGRT
jgi:splicing factor 3A subunit 1